jgi:hypothetical protein
VELAALHTQQTARRNWAVDGGVCECKGVGEEKKLKVRSCLITPIPGEAVLLKSEQKFGEWWKVVE